MGTLAISPRVVGVPIGLSAAFFGGAAIVGWLLFSGKQFSVLSAAKVRSDRLAMDESATVWGSLVHVLASDQGRKAFNGSSLHGGGWLGAQVTFEESAIPL